MPQKAAYIEVVVPLAVERRFTYAVPEHLIGAALPGMRVLVEVGKRKQYSALVWQAVEEYEGAAKEIIEVIDARPVLTPVTMKLWEWISHYYVCPLGLVMLAALPAHLRLQSETLLSMHHWDEVAEEPKERDIQQALSYQDKLSIDQVRGILGIKTVMPLISRLIEQGKIRLAESVEEKYAPKTIRKFKLAFDPSDEPTLRLAFEALGRAAQQKALLMYLVAQPAGKMFAGERLQEECGVSAATIKALVDKGLLAVELVEVDRLERTSTSIKHFKLSEAQAKAFEEIQRAFQKKNVALLHGITGSGKTEIYIRLIEKTIAEGKQVLYLLPEIALTSQMIRRLTDVFGDRVGVYHSRYSNNERVEVWRKVLGDSSFRSYDILLGARSALFLPFENLGLIIVDEEHETSYKQAESHPHYHARDAAIYLASIHKAKVLLGSATPSLESLHNAAQGKYELIKLSERYGNVKMPKIELVDMRKAKKLGSEKFLSEDLIEEMKRVIARKGQIILFQNRRGYSPLLECYNCGHVAYCPNCEVSLTIHRQDHSLKCHYCGFARHLPPHCDQCESTDIRMKGFGTERIEDELRLLIPEARVVRLDFDSTRGKFKFQQIITDFENHAYDIMVGTQMVTKGLDFEHVRMVGILSADQMLHFPDFRSNERSYQMIEQVAGRAGRRSVQGKVLIQTFQPEHPVLLQIMEGKYMEMVRREMERRQEFSYPPFQRLIFVNVRHKDLTKVNFVAENIAAKLEEVEGIKLLGPTFPLIPRIRNEYSKGMLIKIPKKFNPEGVKRYLEELKHYFQTQRGTSTVWIDIDVDPN